MTYTLTVEQINSITDPECAFGTTRLLPAMEDIPAEFKGNSTDNPYVALVNALFYGGKVPSMRIELMEGLSAPKLHRCVHAHLTSFEPKHERKMAGVAYMIAMAGTLLPDAPAGEVQPN